MNDRVQFVLRGWLELTAEEQGDLLASIREYNESSPAERSVLVQENKSLVMKRISLGPLSGGCTCCGK